MDPDKLVILGTIATAHGLRGEVLFRPVNRGSDLPAPGMGVVSTRPGAAPRNMLVEASRRADKGLLLSFRGVGDRLAAEALAGATLAIARKNLPVLGPGEYYWEDVVGSPVRRADGTEVGRVEDIFRSGTDVLVVVGPDGEQLVPVAEGFVDEIGPDGVVLGRDADV